MRDRRIHESGKYMFSVGVYLLISLLLVTCSTQSSGDLSQQELVQARSKVLLISFDGFRADYLSSEHTPFLQELSKNGARSEGLIPVFPSKTFPNHYAIAVGLYPENNGIIGNSMVDTVMGKSYSLGDREQVENPNWYEGEPIWNTAEKQGVRAGTMFWVGSEAPIQDMRPTHWKSYDGTLPDSARIDTVLAWLGSDSSSEVDFATVYFSFLDSQGHRYGTDAPQTIKALQRVDTLMSYLMQQLASKGLDQETNIVLVSDHGMHNVSRERVVRLDSFIDIDRVRWISGSPSVTLNIDPSYRMQAYQELRKAQENGAPFNVYLKQDIPERFRYKNHDRTPDLLLLANLGYTITTTDRLDSRPNFPSGGAHGYDPTHPEMHAIFMAIGPDIVPGSVLPPFEVVHVYELLTHLLGIAPAPNDGNLETFEGILYD